ncbi:MAG: DUF1464 family protein [Thermoleophilia bacterium]|jgi:predicted butyrate kinase (DUF1464 family)|nr:DUF1464 family protein [Thermoleophilia bacterium]
MSRVLGIDPGTVSFDVCGRDGEEVFLDATMATPEVGADPMGLVDLLRGAGPVELIVGPSGYGLPWVHAADVGPEELDLLLLAGGEDGPRGSIVRGMGRLLLALRDSGLPVCFAPGVVHLPTVPDHRKVNRIDMGTADKLCAVALGVWDQARRLAVSYDETSLLYVELGGAFTAVVAVEGGAVVDGSGGTCGAMGYRALGAMDGELAFLLGGFAKDTLASGGMAWVAGRPDAAAEEVVAAAAEDGRAAAALDAFLEDLVKQVAGHVAVTGEPREIVLSGRLARVPALRDAVAGRLERFAPVPASGGFAEHAGEAAQGAALIAQGLLGGGAEEALVDALHLREARGSALDHLYIAEADALRRRHPQSRRVSSPVARGGST